MDLEESMAKAKRKLKAIAKAIMIMALILVIFLFLLYLYWRFVFYPIEHIKVRLIASYEPDLDMDDTGYGFCGDYSVSDLKGMLREEYWIQTFGGLEGFSEKLDKLDNDTKIVISKGKEIRYLWWPKKDYMGYIQVKYRIKKPQNKIYFYTTEYKGAITTPPPIGY